MDTTTARKRRYRQRRRARGTKAYEVWLPEHLVDELRQPDETMNAFVARALTALQQQAPGAMPVAVGTPQQQRKAAIMPRLRAMRAQGMSHQAIATTLTAEWVPTISGRGNWTSGAVGKLLAEAEA
jgi:hypothetical protein